jgi:hypothetical protein
MATNSLFNHATPPFPLDTGDTNDTGVSLGVTLKPTVNGNFTSLWVYIGNTNLTGTTGTATLYTGASWADTSTPISTLGQQTFSFRSSAGWQEIVLNSPIAATAGTIYIACIYFPNGHYAANANYFTAEVTSGTLVGLKGTGTPPYDIGNGRYIYGGSPAYPQSKASNNANYWIDVTFDDGSSGGGGSPVSLSIAADNASPNKGASATLTATASDGTNYTYAWSVQRLNGTFGSSTSATTTYTPSAVGRHVIKCVLTASEGTVTKYLTLNVGQATAATSVTLTSTVTDPLNATANGSKTGTITRGGGVRYQQRSLFGHRINFGDPVVNSAGLLQVVDDQPATYATKMYLQRDCLLTAIRYMKRPEASGDYVFAVWQGTNTIPLISQTVPFVADAGGWITIALDAPLQLTASDTVPYVIGYFSPDGKVYYINSTFGSQDVLEYPFYIKYNNGAFGNIEATGWNFTTQLSYPNNWRGHNYMIDPIVEWESDDVVYTGGSEYYQRFSAASNMTYFPIGLWQPLPSTTPQLPALGINTVVTLGQGDFEGGMAAVVNAGINVIPQLEIGAYSTLARIEANPAFNTLVKGYLMADEPDMIAPWKSPSDLQAWYVELRKRDASKLLIFNLGKWVVHNRGFAALPAGADMKTLNSYWRQYGHLTDIISTDFYMEDSRNTEGGLYGLWCNPRMVQRLGDLSDTSRPIWHYVSTAATPDNQPSTDLVYKSVWASLIGGARGIVFFDYTFTSGGSYVTDFSMGTNNAMYTMIQSLTSFIQSIKGALLGPELLSVISSVTSSNTTAGPVGGTYGVPIHYTVRQDSGYTYLFTQSIRPGTTTATFTVPAAANKTITVLQESRTITANSSGVFSDNFASDYAVHLYRWA